MADLIRLAGSTLDRSRHVCAFFHGREEEYRVLLPFIKEGIDRGEKAFHVVDPSLRSDHLERLARVVDVARAEHVGQLEVRTWDAVYLRGGHFDQDAMLVFIADALKRGRAEGFPLTRFVASMNWAVEDRPGVGDIAAYEARLNAMLPKDDPIICTYDLAKFGAGQIVDVVRVHPLAIIGGTLVENPFFTPPDALLAEMRSRTAAPQPADDIALFRGSLREIISLSALTVVWRDRELSRIAEDLVESLLVTVRPDLMYVRLEGVTAEAPVEATRARDQAGVLRPRPEIARALAPLLISPDSDVREVPDPTGAGSVRLATVPIGAAGNFGVLAAGFRSPDLPTETDRLLLRVAANQAAGTFETLANERLRLEVVTRRQAEQHEAQLASELRALAAHVTSAREEERRRIALELHDELGQALTALKFDLGRLGRGFPKDTETRCHLQGMLDRVVGTIRSVRRIGTQLHPPVLDTLGLSDAIDWQVKEFQARTGIRCTVFLRAGPLDLSADRATPLFRILQEALTNVAKHARATRVTVSLRRHGDNLQLRIRDNGKGFRSPDRADVRALGIVGMRERAILLSGEATITSVRGRGTAVTVRIPYGRPDASERRRC